MHARHASAPRHFGAAPASGRGEAYASYLDGGVQCSTHLSTQRAGGASRRLAVYSLAGCSMMRVELSAALSVPPSPPLLTPNDPGPAASPLGTQVAQCKMPTQHAVHLCESLQLAMGRGAAVEWTRTPHHLKPPAEQLLSALAGTLALTRICPPVIWQAASSGRWKPGCKLHSPQDELLCKKALAMFYKISAVMSALNPATLQTYSGRQQTGCKWQMSCGVPSLPTTAPPVTAWAADALPTPAASLESPS